MTEIYGMLTLLTFPGDSDQPSFSPFCLKAMCLLNMSGRDWSPKYLKDPSKMPHGRLPVLKTGDRLIPDSANIQYFLESEGAEFNEGLSDTNKAQSHAMIRMVEENLRCGMAHDRWLRDDCWQHVRQAFFSSVPAPFRGMVSGMIRKKVRQALMSQGIAQFSEPDRLDRLGRDLKAIETVLGDRPYLFGAQPTAADAAALPVLDMIRTLPCDTGLRRLVRERPALMAYIERARERLYPT